MLAMSEHPLALDRRSTIQTCGATLRRPNVDRLSSASGCSLMASISPRSCRNVSLDRQLYHPLILEPAKSACSINELHFSRVGDCRFDYKRQFELYSCNDL